MNTVQITARISPKSRDILVREASGLLNNAKSRLSVGEILDALILYTEELNEWEEIADLVRSERRGQREFRLAKDRERKRRQG
jgi:hypothetical protein